MDKRPSSGQSHRHRFAAYLSRSVDPVGSIVLECEKLTIHLLSLFRLEAATALASVLNVRYSKLVFPRVNLVDKIWKTRPPKPQGQVFILDRKFAGKSSLHT